jgi:hypothetical protein
VKLFNFYRIEDQSGVSGTGPVVEGVQFSNGWCALRWLSETSSLCFYQSIEEVKKVHGHGGKTEIVVHDFEPRRSRKTTEGARNRRFSLLMQVIEEAAGMASAASDPQTPGSEYLDAIGRVRVLLDEIEVLSRGSDKGRAAV